MILCTTGLLRPRLTVNFSNWMTVSLTRCHGSANPFNRYKGLYETTAKRCYCFTHSVTPHSTLDLLVPRFCFPISLLSNISLCEPADDWLTDWWEPIEGDDEQELCRGWDDHQSITANSVRIYTSHSGMHYAVTSAKGKPRIVVFKRLLL